MKIAETEHNDIDYRFEYFEYTNEVDVYKDGILTYHITVSKKWILRCDCPGFRHRGYCWHSNFAPVAISADSIAEPWAKWNEEIREERYNYTPF